MMAGNGGGKRWYPWGVSEIRFVVLCSSPVRPYLQVLLESWKKNITEATLNVAVAGGIENNPELAELSKKYQFTVLTLPKFNAYTRRAIHLSYVHILQDPVADFRGICICADDIVFRQDFDLKLVDCLNAAGAGKWKEGLFTGYTSFDLSDHHSLTLTKAICRVPARWFGGTQCLVFPKPIVDEVASFISLHGHLAEQEPNGSIFNRYARIRNNLFGARRSLVQHIGEISVLTPSADFLSHQSPTFERPWPGAEEVQEYGRRRQHAVQVAESVEPETENRFAGEGIVICAGGVKYFTCAWICVRMLRRLGCRLPVEFWHLGPEEMTPEMQALAEEMLKVRCVDAHKVRKVHPARRLGGWELKCYAILHSRFREVLLLDADNVPVVNPRFLFDTPEYKETGAIFWPDIGSLGPEKDIWKITGVPYNPNPDFESGQIVVDKKRCWRALQLAMHYNEHSDFYYQYIYGDKDTFRFAFLKTGTPFSMPEGRIEYIEGTLCQHDFTGRRVFQHRIKKWSLRGKNKKTEGFLYEADCLGYLDELRGRWREGMPAALGPKNLLIPRLLHRLWLGPEPLSARQKRWARSWKRHHPQWEERVWTAENLPELINRQEYEAATDVRQRQEIASYEVLHRFGGLWVDADFECRRSLEGLLLGEECVLGEESPGRICHGLIACVPGHELLKELVRGLPNSVRDHAGKSIVEQTGANYVTRKLQNRWDVTVLPPDYFHPHAHAPGERPEERRSVAAGAGGEATTKHHLSSRGGMRTYAVHHPSPRWVPETAVEYRRRHARFTPEGRSVRELAAVERLTSGMFDYHRVGHDRRPIEFLPDGSIGRGAGGCEKAWDLWEEKEGLQLSIFGSGYATCRLTRQDDGCWHGRWLICEKMPVELTPLG